MLKSVDSFHRANQRRLITVPSAERDKSPRISGKAGAAVCRSPAEVIWGDASVHPDCGRDRIDVRARYFLTYIRQHVGETDFHSNEGIEANLGDLGAIN